MMGGCVSTSSVNRTGNTEANNEEETTNHEEDMSALTAHPEANTDKATPPVKSADDQEHHGSPAIDFDSGFLTEDQAKNVIGGPGNEDFWSRRGVSLWRSGDASVEFVEVLEMLFQERPPEKAQVVAFVWNLFGLTFLKLNQQKMSSQNVREDLCVLLSNCLKVLREIVLKDSSIDPYVLLPKEHFTPLLDLLLPVPTPDQFIRDTWRPCIYDNESRWSLTILCEAYAWFGGVAIFEEVLTHLTSLARNLDWQPRTCQKFVSEMWRPRASYCGLIQHTRSGNEMFGHPLPIVLQFFRMIPAFFNVLLALPLDLTLCSQLKETKMLTAIKRTVINMVMTPLNEADTTTVVENWTSDRINPDAPEDVNQTLLELVAQFELDDLRIGYDENGNYKRRSIEEQFKKITNEASASLTSFEEFSAALEMSSQFQGEWAREIALSKEAQNKLPESEKVPEPLLRYDAFFNLPLFITKFKTLQEAFEQELKADKVDEGITFEGYEHLGKVEVEISKSLKRFPRLSHFDAPIGRIIWTRS